MFAIWKSEDSFIAIKSVILIWAVSYQLLISGNGGTVNSFLDLLVGSFIFLFCSSIKLLHFSLNFSTAIMFQLRS